MFCIIVIFQQIFLRKDDQDNQLHFLWTRGFSIENYSKIEPCAKQAMKRYGFESAMLSFIEMWKHDCITKERYEVLTKTKDGDENEEQTKEQERIGFTGILETTDETVGDDVERFIKKIKNGELTKAKITEFGEESKNLHLLCLMNGDDRRKLERNEKDIRKTFSSKIMSFPLCLFQEETEYKDVKYSRSLATRKTYIIGPKIDNIFLYTRCECLKSLIGLPGLPTPRYCVKRLYTGP